VPKLDRLVKKLARRLAKSGSDTALLDIQVAAAEMLGFDRSWVLSNPEYGLTKQQAKTLTDTSTRLEAGEPLAYILGHREFFGLDFRLNPNVLVPRPETELLVEQALEWMLQKSRRGKGCLALDAGTGSGCIAVSLAVRSPRVKVVAVDISAAAVVTAQENAIFHDVDDRVHFLQADLVPRISQPFDLICANLPYIPLKTLEGLGLTEWEPALALDGGPDGLDLIRRMITTLAGGSFSTRRILAPDSLLLFEIEASQGVAAVQFAEDAFPGEQVQLLKDLAGHDRLLRIETGFKKNSF